MKHTLITVILFAIVITTTGQNDKAVFNITLTEANKGNIEAQLTLATFYLTGKGVEIDTLKAINELQKSAVKGLTLTQNILGDIHFNKTSAYYDIQQSLSWYMQSAIQGDTHSQTQLAICFYYGYGVETSKEKAAGWLYMAIMNNSNKAIQVWDELEMEKYHIKQPKEEGIKGYKITEIYYSDYDTAFALPLAEHIITMKFKSDTATGFFGISKQSKDDTSTAFVGVLGEMTSRPSVFAEGVATSVFPIRFASAITPEKEGDAYLTKEFLPEATELDGKSVCFFQLIFPNKGYELQIYAELIETFNNK